MLSVMDPALPRGGANLLFGILFAENCVKMNKIGLGSRDPQLVNVVHLSLH